MFIIIMKKSGLYMLTVLGLCGGFTQSYGQEIYSGTATFATNTQRVSSSNTYILEAYFSRTESYIDSFPPILDQQALVTCTYHKGNGVPDSLQIYLSQSGIARISFPLKEDSIYLSSTPNTFAYIKVLRLAGDSLVCWFRKNRVWEELVPNDGGPGHHYEQYWSYTIGQMNLKQVAADVSRTNDKQKFNLYPNPATNYIIVPIKYSSSQKLKIYSAGGHQTKYSLREMENELIMVDISTFAAGSYFISVDGDPGVTYKFCKY